MTEPNIAFVANLMADPSRAAMCLTLAGGEARPAGELAARAGVSAQTASNHLAKLIAGRILRVEQQGCWRYYRHADAEVGHAVEALAVVAPPLPRRVETDGIDGAAKRLKEARTFYSHLAGRLGVALADALVADQPPGLLPPPPLQEQEEDRRNQVSGPVSPVTGSPGNRCSREPCGKSANDSVGCRLR